MINEFYIRCLLTKLLTLLLAINTDSSADSALLGGYPSLLDKMKKSPPDIM